MRYHCVEYVYIYILPLAAGILVNESSTDMAAIVPTEALAAALDGSAVGGDEGAKMFVTMDDHVRALITRVASIPAVLMDAASIVRGSTQGGGGMAGLGAVFADEGGGGAEGEEGEDEESSGTITNVDVALGACETDMVVLFARLRAVCDRLTGAAGGSGGESKAGGAAGAEGLPLPSWIEDGVRAVGEEGGSSWNRGSDGVAALASAIAAAEASVQGFAGVLRGHQAQQAESKE